MRSDNIFQKVSDKKWPLSRNENLTEFGSRYPDYSELHEFLETKFDIPRQYICLTSGAEEAIRICLSSPNYPNRLNFIPTWGLVSIFNNLYGTEKVKELHLKQDLSYNISKLKKHIENNQIVYLANPNNVGSFTTASELIELIKRFNKTIFIIDETYADSGLGKWFKEKWVRFDTKGKIKGDCAREAGEGKPKCLPKSKAHAMSKKDRAKSARRKRRKDPVADRKGKGGNPINVKTEQLNIFLEKNVPNDPSKWSYAKAQAKKKYDVYPSLYANAWASNKYKELGGTWRKSKKSKK